MTEAIVGVHAAFCRHHAPGIVQAVLETVEGADVELIVQVAYGAGIELGLRASSLEPETAERIRDALTEEVHKRGDPAGLHSAIHRAQTYLDAARRAGA